MAGWIVLLTHAGNISERGDLQLKPYERKGTKFPAPVKVNVPNITKKQSVATLVPQVAAI